MSNIDLLERLVSEASPEKPLPNEWVVTIYFYTALHVVEKKLHAEKNIHSKDHTDRFKHISEHYSDILPTYQSMKNDSMTARYKSRRITPEKVEETKENLYTICREFREANIINRLNTAHGVGVIRQVPSPVSPPITDTDLSDAK